MPASIDAPLTVSSSSECDGLPSLNASGRLTETKLLVKAGQTLGKNFFYSKARQRVETQKMRHTLSSVVGLAQETMQALADSPGFCSPKETVELFQHNSCASFSAGADLEVLVASVHDLTCIISSTSPPFSLDLELPAPQAPVGFHERCQP